MAIEIKLTGQDAFEYMAQLAANLSVAPASAPEPLTRYAPNLPTVPTDAALTKEIIDSVSHVQLPNVQAAPSVPSTVAVPPPPTAPEANEDTSLDLASVFGQPAVMPPPPAVPVAPPTVPPAPEGKFLGDNRVSVTETTTYSSIPGVAPVTTVTPAANNAPTMPQPIAPKLDKDNMPWDGRIHASTQGFNKDGTWRLKRGISDELLQTVTAELKATMALPGPATVDPRQQAIVWPHHPDYVPPPPPPTPPAPPPPAPPSITAPVTAVPTPPATTVPQPAAATAPAASGPIGFTQLVQTVVQRKTAGTITQEQIDQALSLVGIKSLPLLTSRPDLIPTVAAALGI